MDIAALPKVELHCHLDGILTPEMARAIRAEDPAFPVGPDDLGARYPVNSLERFLHWWGALEPTKGNLRYFYPIIAQYIAELKAQNVRYFELMVAHGELPRDPGEVVPAIQAFREWVDEQAGDDIQVEFLVALGRNKALDFWSIMADKVMALHEAGLIVGVALADLEIGYPVKPLHKHFARFHEAGLGIEIHAGEWVGPESVWDALEHGYPDRIGHGVTLFDDPKLIALFQERQIHVEMCPTSNLCTGSVACLEDHPIQQARDLGLNFSINTDDPGPFLNTMNGEYQLAADLFGFDETDFQQIYTNALAARFQPELRISSLLG